MCVLICKCIGCLCTKNKKTTNHTNKQTDKKTQSVGPSQAGRTVLMSLGSTGILPKDIPLTDVLNKHEGETSRGIRLKRECTLFWVTGDSFTSNYLV